MAELITLLGCLTALAVVAIPATLRARRRRALSDLLFARMRGFLGNPRGPFADEILPGNPVVRVEERPGGAWLLVARWPVGLQIQPRDASRAAWTPRHELFDPTCGTVTAQALQTGREVRAVFSIDALRVPWDDPLEDPAAAVERLRGLWWAVVAPSADDLEDGVHENGTLRAANLLVLARLDRERARALANTLTPGHGRPLFAVALAVEGDAEQLTAYVRGDGEPWIRVAAVQALAEITDPEALLPHAHVCWMLPETALAFAQGVSAHRTPARDQFVRGQVLTGLTGWPDLAARQLAEAAYTASPRDEEVLLALLRAPGQAARKALAALATHGTVASVPTLRAWVASGELRAQEVEPLIAAIQSRASGTRGALAVVEAVGGGLSEPTGGGTLTVANGEEP